MGERERGREGRKENRVEKKGKKVGGGGDEKREKKQTSLPFYTAPPQKPLVRSSKITIQQKVTAEQPLRQPF